MIAPRPSRLSALRQLRLCAEAPRLAAQTFTVRPVVTAGQSAPGGGTFSARAGRELFLASGSGITKVTVEGDPAPGGGTISGLGRHPVPALNADGTVAFAASVGRTTRA